MFLFGWSTFQQAKSLATQTQLVSGTLDACGPMYTKLQFIFFFFLMAGEEKFINQM